MAVTLAVLGGLLIFMLAGDLLVGNDDGGGEASPYEDQAAQIEQSLLASPQDPELLLSLAGARFNAGKGLIKEGSRLTSAEVIQQFRLASEAWSEYLDVVSEPNISAATAMAPVYVALAEAASDVAGFREEMRRAATVSEIVAKQTPSVDALMTLAYYRDFAFDWKAADRAAADALALTRTRPEFEKVKHALAEYQQQARETKSTEG